MRSFALREEDGNRRGTARNCVYILGFGNVVDSDSADGGEPCRLDTMAMSGSLALVT